MWAEKYKPLEFKEFAGNAKAAGSVLEWIKSWPQEKKALLVYGPPGIGKTTAMPLLAKKLNFTLIETNASDLRSAGQLKEQFTAALRQQTLFFKGRLVVFDEIDGLSPGDRGGVGEIIKLIKESTSPVILIANDVWVTKLRSLRSYCQMIEFKALKAEEIERILKKILAGEKVRAEPRVLESLARRAAGDLKGAINDLEFLAQGKRLLKQEDLEQLGWRDVRREIFEVLKIIFKTSTARTALEAMENTVKDPEEIALWVRENLPAEYTNTADLAAAYEVLSRADIFRGRIRRQQYWRFLAYFVQLISAGISMAKASSYPKRFVRYQYPKRIIALTRTKGERAAAKELTAALGAQLHCSRKVARQYLPLIELMQEEKPNMWQGVAEKIGLET